MNIRFHTTFRPIRKTVVQFIAGEDAPTAVEYAILASLIGAVIVVVVTAIGGQVADMFVPVVRALPT